MTRADSDLAEVLLYEVCREFNIPIRSIRQYNRKEPIATARNIILALAPGRADMVSKHFNRSRCAASHARRKVRDRCETEPKFRALVNTLKKRLSSFSGV